MGHFSELKVSHDRHWRLDPSPHAGPTRPDRSAELGLGARHALAEGMTKVCRELCIDGEDI